MKKRSILIVDDDVFFLKGLSDALEEAGFASLTAKSWADIMEILSRKIPDLILLDLVIPSLDGEKICNVLKKNKKTSSIPILLYSGQKKDELQNIAIRSGAQGIIEKSTDFEEIIINIYSFLKSWNSN